MSSWVYLQWRAHSRVVDERGAYAYRWFDYGFSVRAAYVDLGLCDTLGHSPLDVAPLHRWYTY